MKRILKIFSLTIISLAVFAVLIPIAQPVEAQSGGGVDVCTYWKENSFPTEKACNNWLAAKQSQANYYWQNKLVKCASFSGVAVGVEFWAKMVLGWKQIVASYGLQFAGCMFL